MLYCRTRVLDHVVGIVGMISSPSGVDPGDNVIHTPFSQLPPTPTYFFSHINDKPRMITQSNHSRFVFKHLIQFILPISSTVQSVQHNVCLQSVLIIKVCRLYERHNIGWESQILTVMEQLGCMVCTQTDRQREREREKEYSPKCIFA